MGYISGKKILTIGIMIIMVASSLAIMPLVTGDSQSLNKINYIPHAPIEITSNADFASQGWPGNGTELNPWRIEGVMIDGDANGYCIKIDYTTDYFKIQNCLLLNASGNTIYYDSEISLEQVENATIQDNVINNNFKGTSTVIAGISIDTCKNIRIINNTITKNYYGLCFTELHDSFITDFH